MENAKSGQGSYHESIGIKSDGLSSGTIGVVYANFSIKVSEFEVYSSKTHLKIKFDDIIRYKN